MPRMNRTDLTMTTTARYRTTNSWKSKNILRISTWNIKSLNTREQEITKELADRKIDICALQETKRKGKGQSMLDNYIMIYSGVPKEVRAKEGVAILVHKKLMNQIVECKYISERIVYVKIKIGDKHMNVVGVYAPENNRDVNTRETFYEDLQRTTNQISPNEYMIIMGDLNARVGDEVIPGIKQRHNENIRNDNGDLLTDFCSTNEIRINNTFFHHKEQYKYTFEDTRGRRSMIDYILTNRELHPSQILDVRALTSAEIGSDHKLVLGKIRMKKPIYYNRNDQADNTTKIKIESLQDDSIRYLYQKRLAQKIENNKTTENDGVEESWMKIKTNILSAAKESVGETKTNKNSRFQKKTPWFCEEVKEKCREKKKAYLEYVSNRTQQTYDKYKRIRNETHTLVRKIKNDHWERFSKEMEHDFYGLQKEMWRFIRGQRAEMKELIEAEHIDENTWIDYLQKLYREEEPTPSESENPDIISNEETVINESEVEKAQSELKNRKAAGKDGIANELLKYGGTLLTKELTTLINKILKDKKVPEEWKISVLILLFKKGDKKEPENYRGINLLNTTLKLTTKILSKQINQKITLTDEQQGFRSGRSCTDAIFVIRQIIEKALEYNKPAFLCFIDLKKAFDRVRLKDVIHLLYKREIPLDVIKTIEDIYRQNRIEARIDGRLTKPIDMGTGIRQGDSLSPLLFNLMMDEIIKKVNFGKGYRMGNKEIKILCYADDAVLIAQDEDNLQRLVHRFNISAKKFNMTISTQKTKTLVINKEPIRCKIEIDGTSIQQTMEMKYLGITLSSYGELEAEVGEQVQRANKVAGCLNNTIWRNKHIRTETKSRIYKTIIRPIMTYAAETRPDTAKTCRLLETAEMRILRRITGNTLRDRVRSDEVRRRCNTERINEWTLSRKREWNDHISRMEENRLVKTARDKSPSGRRSTGRPRKRWSDNIA